MVDYVAHRFTTSIHEMLSDYLTLDIIFYIIDWIVLFTLNSVAICSAAWLRRPSPAAMQDAQARSPDRRTSRSRSRSRSGGRGGSSTGILPTQDEPCETWQETMLESQETPARSPARSPVRSHVRPLLLRSVTEVFSWPRRLIEKLDPEALDNLSSVFSGGVHVETMYSGMDCPMQALDMVRLEVEAKRPMAANKFKVRNYSAWDSDDTCRKVLLASSGAAGARQACGPRHVFGDIRQLLSADLYNKLEQIHGEVQALYDVKMDYLLDYYHKFQNIPAAAKKELARDMAALTENEMMLAMQGHTLPAEGTATAFCYRHECQCKVQDFFVRSRCQVRCLIAGSTCTDDSPMGHRKAGFGKAAIPFMIMMWYIKQDMPHFFLHENSHLFDEERIRKHIGNEYHIMTVRMSPHQFGVPNTRTRKITLCTRRSHVAMRAVFSCKALAPFQATSALSGEDCFFVAPEAEVQKFIKETAAQKRIHWVKHALDLLSPGDFIRLQIHAAVHDQAQAAAAGSSRGSSSGTCDPRQTARGKVSHALGCITTKALPVGLKVERRMLPKELLWAMGVPVYSASLTDSVQHYRCPFEHILDELPPAQVTKLAGNGMSLVVIGTALAFSLSNMLVLDPTKMSGVWHDDD